MVAILETDPGLGEAGGSDATTGSRHSSCICSDPGSSGRVPEAAAGVSEAAV
jgi:hypothetical protein